MAAYYYSSLWEQDSQVEGRALQVRAVSDPRGVVGIEYGVVPFSDENRGASLESLMVR